jgi:DNA-3-methyladenine glycosylase I
MPEHGRCAWAVGNELMASYHDEEWGVPIHDDRHLFELLILEGAQAGLSWLTILKKREGYRRAFRGFEPRVVASFCEEDFERLMGDAGIVRNRLKIRAAIENAKALLRLWEEGFSLDELLWGFVDRQPRINSWRELAEIPASTPESAAMSRELKGRGFRFVGPTVCYAFMQSAGMVNDHTVDCFRYPELKP